MDDCPTGCGRKCNTTVVVMCRVCWGQVPAPLQREVYAAWRARKAMDPDTWPRHEAAKEAAIESVRRGR
jgi:hypothetical protein